ncbi:helix-turn-helix domain-containing protein [Catenulispora rubra]|uniref:helix-turn-helix domain-containing protein n=1 Tax=Catenulispora rubra TaxID=280293 RepID=UPI001892373B|nr:helix-turn-helix domain-containing protein [Catenulispora rubra]
MGSKNTTSDLAGALDSVRTAVQDANAEVAGALREVDAEVSAAREQVALIQEVVRTVTDVDTIKALADTTRLSLLRALSRDRVPKSAKELAEDLGEPQTKLYRHLKVLVEAGLIEAAETRVVSGIVETKYRSAQSSLTIDPTAHPVETREAMDRIIDENLADYRKRFLRHLDTLGMPSDPEEAKNSGMLMFLSSTLHADVAADFQKRLEALVKEFDSLPRDPDGVRIEGLVSWFRPQMPEGPDGSAGGER